jgi:hypothetical protein
MDWLLYFFYHVNTTTKLTNTNAHTNIIFMSIDYSEFFRLNISSQYLSVNTDENILLIYTERITMKKGKNEKKESRNTMTCYFYRQNYPWI